MPSFSLISIPCMVSADRRYSSFLMLVVAVSYTHLDVYKRQIPETADDRHPACRCGLPCALIFTAHIGAVDHLIAIDRVSDVYKRQAMMLW